MEEAKDMGLEEAELEIKAKMETEFDIENAIIDEIEGDLYYMFQGMGGLAPETEEVSEREEVSGKEEAALEEEEEEEEMSNLIVPQHLGLCDPIRLERLSSESKTELVWSFTNKFDCESIARLSEELFDDEDEPKLVVYLCVTKQIEETLNMSWIAVDSNNRHQVGTKGRKVVSMSCVDDVMKNPDSGFPSELLDLTCYGCCSWRNMIVIAGGKYKEVPSKMIFIYETNSGKWHIPSHMQLERGEKPTVVVADAHIFIFGGVPKCFDANPDTQTGCWAESLALFDGDIKRFLPSFDSDYTDICFPNIISHAVYPLGHKILFWLDSGIVLSFDYQRECWAKYEKPMMIADGPQLQWNNKVAVVADILFWHNHGTIVSHDLLKGVTTPVYTLPHTGFSKVLFSDQIPPTFLAHIGKGKLCLFYQVDNRICYFTFLVQVSLSKEELLPLIVLRDSGLLQNTLGWNIMHALEVLAL